MQIRFEDLRRICVAIDPAGGHGEGADDTGIVVAARGPHQDETCKLIGLTGRCPGHGYILADLTCHVAPHEWARRAVKAFDRFKADLIVAEKNFGGEMVEATIRTVRAGVPVKIVSASRGKAIRAQPVASLSEQGRIHFLSPCDQLVDEMTSWTEEANWSPNRMDAAVWAISALDLIGGQGHAFLQLWRGEIASRKASATSPAETQREQAIRDGVARRLRGRPHFGAKPESGSLTREQLRCQHRWRPAGNGHVACVFCNLDQGAIANVVPLR